MRRLANLTIVLCCLNVLSAQVSLTTIEVGDFQLIEVDGIDKQIAEDINKKILFHSVPSDGIDFSLGTYGVLKQLELNFKKNNDGVLEIYTATTYNQDNILSLKIKQSFIGAYLSTSTTFLNFSIEIGELIHLDDIVNDSGFLYIDKSIKAEIAKRIERTIVDLEEEDDDDFNREKVSKIFSTSSATFAYPVDFNYSNEGISFYVNYGLPHVLQAIEPSNEFKFKYSELLDYFSKDENSISNYNPGTFSTMPTYRSLIFENPLAYSELNLGEGKVTCNVCVNNKGNVTYVEVIDTSTDSNVIPVGEWKDYLRAVRESKFEPNFETEKLECKKVAKYFYNGM